MPYTFTLVSVSDSGFRYLEQVMTDFDQDDALAPLFQKEIVLHPHFVGEQRTYEEKLSRMARDMRSSDMVLLDLMGAPGPVVALCEEVSADFTGDMVLLGTGSELLRNRMRLGKFNMAALGKMMLSDKGKSGGKKKRPVDMEKMLTRLETLGRMMPVGPLKDMRNWILMSKYWRFAGPDNVRNMLLLLCRTYGGFSSLPKPGELIDYARYVLFDPEALRGFDTLDDLRSAWGWDEARPTIGVLFYNFNYPNYSVGVLSRIIRRLREKYNVVPLGVSSGPEKFKKIQALLKKGLRLDLLWDFLPFRFGAGPMGGDPDAGLAVFRELNVPVMHPFLLGKRKKEDWEENVRGLSPMEVLICVMLPELDGVTDAIPVAALENHPTSRVGDLQELRVIEGRLDRLMARSEAYLRLRETPNEKKRIAFILYNYPPGEGNVGGGSFLDTFASMERITKAMRDAGYAWEPVTADGLAAAFMTGGGCNTAKWHPTEAVARRLGVGDYLAGDPLHQSMTARISGEWGPPPGEIMTDAAGLMIPGITAGNLFVGLQPSRGTHENPDRRYHDQDLPPHHQYLAFYRWLARDFKAHAVVHVGTHGTLEFLPGKESGMSDTCFPDYLMGDLPHFYLYYSGNPAEATIAKRRAHACLVSYAGPPLRRSGLHGDAAELENLLNEYAESAALSPQKQAQVKERMAEKAAAMKLRVDGEATPDAISHELVRMKTMLMPVGLHEIGAPASDAAAACYLGAMLGWDRGEVRALPDIVRSFLRVSVSSSPSPSPTESDGVNQLTDDLIHDYYFGDKSLYNDLIRGMGKTTGADLRATLAYGVSCLDRIRRTDEIGGLLNALAGNYVTAKLGGDLIRDPEVFPTGHNLFQFDPRLVPSETAMARGREIAESTLCRYRDLHGGAYPETVSVVLWGLETSRTRGETMCQIMAYLGVRLKSTRAAMEKTFEVIPPEELGRPRIDCIVTICGFFRDMYPTLIDFLDAAFDAVAGLHEPDDRNFVGKHSRERYRELADTTDAPTALELSRARIFGPARGQYGTGITTLIESGAWKDETALASAYLDAQKHLYTRNRRGEAREDLFKAGLKGVDLVSQVQSSVDYTFADLDHYYEFFGGLSRSVEAVRGKKPAMLVTDSSSRRIYTDEAAKAIELGVRTRLLNPDYIEEMLKHRVHGAQQINKRVENLVGLAATTGRVDTWVFSHVKETYFDDPDMYERLRENNPYATADMILRLLEAWKRDYWDAPESDIRELKEKYMALEGEIEDVSDIPHDAHF